MNKSTINPTHAIPLAEMPTWQSGILQAAAVRNVRKLTDNYLKSFNITTNHWYILGAISKTGDAGIRITDLADELSVTIGYLTTAINTLSLQGHVVREDHESDTRSKLLKVTPTFQAAAVQIEAGLRDVLRKDIYTKINREQLSTYIEVLQKLSTL